GAGAVGVDAGRVVEGQAVEGQVLAVGVYVDAVEGAADVEADLGVEGRRAQVAVVEPDAGDVVAQVDPTQRRWCGGGGRRVEEDAAAAAMGVHILDDRARRAVDVKAVVSVMGDDMADDDARAADL